MNSKTPIDSVLSRLYQEGTVGRGEQVSVADAKLALSPVVAEIREDEQMKTLKLLRKLGVIDENAMNKLALEGEWRASANLRKAHDQIIREDGER